MEGENRPEQQANQPFNPAAATLTQAAAVLTQAGRWDVTVADLEADIADGAPTNPDGTLNLIHYTAWLVGELNCAD